MSCDAWDCYSLCIASCFAFILPSSHASCCNWMLPTELCCLLGVDGQVERHYLRALHIYTSYYGPNDSNVTKTKTNLVGATSLLLSLNQILFFTKCQVLNFEDLSWLISISPRCLYLTFGISLKMCVVHACKQADSFGACIFMPCLLLHFIFGV